ncbi:MAG: kelch repeat-containing protein [Bacteroidota bacterium]|jgi:N-acetylneuraminic acid mutarotase
MKNKILRTWIFLLALFFSIHSIAQVFQTTASFNDARYAHCTAQSNNDKVLIFGGAISSGSSINSVYEYDPALNSWSAKTSIPNSFGLSKSTCVKLSNGNVILFGGSQNGSIPQSNKVFQYNLSSDSWTLLSTLPNSQGREQMRSTLINDSTVLLTGGIATISSALNYPTTCYLYNTNTNTFTLVGNLPNGIINHTSTLLANGEVLITGGFDGNAARNEAYVYNLLTGWRTLSSTLSLAASSHKAFLLNGKVYIYGGFNIPLFQFSDKLDIYDPTNDSIMPLNTGPLACSQFAMVPFNSNILIAGGNKVLPNTSFGVTNEAYLYNVNNNTFTTISNLPSARSGMEIMELGSTGKFIFSGGHTDLSSPFNDAIIYDANLSVGIKENNLFNQAQLYPNPCQNELRLKINTSLYLNKYEVYNSFGQLVLSGEKKSDNFLINTGELPEGFYIVSINGASHKRFQVVR